MSLNIALIRLNKKTESSFQHPRHIHPPLSLQYIKAALDKKNYNTQIFDSWINNWSLENYEQMLKGQYDFVFIKAMSYCIEEALELGKMLSRNNIKSVAIGQFVSHASEQLPEGWLDCFDASLLGEPEEISAEFLEKLKTEDFETVKKKYNDQFLNKIETLVEDPNKLPELPIDKKDFEAEEPPRIRPS